MVPSGSAEINAQILYDIFVHAFAENIYYLLISFFTTIKGKKKDKPSIISGKANSLN